MIVADTNLIAYLLITGPHSREAEAVFKKDSEWAAPLLWRSEFRNVLVSSFRRGVPSLQDAIEIMDRAERLMNGREHQMESPGILKTALESGCTAYDAEFVALARGLSIPLVTTDNRLIRIFKPTAISMREFCS